jgi:nitrogen regulatory protein PII
MKLVTALLRPEQFPAVKKALFDAEFRRLTAASVMGTVPVTEQMMYRGEAREISLFRRVKVEVYVDDEQVDLAVEKIAEGARMHGAWGRVFVTDVVSSRVIWTGEGDDDTPQPPG